MRRKIIEIDEDRCTGCGQCVTACAEGALEVVDGKARLVKEIFCDGLGACLGQCPEDALRIVEREADAFDPAAVQAHLGASKKNESVRPAHGHAGICPGAALRTLTPATAAAKADGPAPATQLGHWPVQLRLIPAHAPFLKGAHLLVCADCVAYVVPDFHSRYVSGRAVLVGCPKLDNLAEYREKLRAILSEARPASLTVLRMEVPCCAGIAQAALEARQAVAPELPAEVHVIGIRGGIQRQTLPALAPVRGAR